MVVGLSGLEVLGKEDGSVSVGGVQVRQVGVTTILYTCIKFLENKKIARINRT